VQGLLEGSYALIFPLQAPNASFNVFAGRLRYLFFVHPVPPLQLGCIMSRIACVIHSTAKRIKHTSVNMSSFHFLQTMVQPFRIPLFQVNDPADPDIIQ
jgi:hypothetical protein